MNKPYHLNSHKNHNSAKEFQNFMNPEDEEILNLNQLNSIDKTPYNVLGVSPNSSKEEIKKNYFKKIKQEHPDKNFGNNENKTQEINSAYEILSDPVKKASHDILGNVEKGMLLFDGSFENDEDLRNKFIKIKKKLQKLERENLMQSQSNILLGLNWTNKTMETFDCTNSWQTAITNSDIFIFKSKSNLQISDGEISPSFTNAIGYRRLFSSASYVELDSIFHPNGILWSATGEMNLFERLNGGVRWFGFLYPQVVPFSVSPYLRRDFGDNTKATLTVNLGRSYDANLDINKKYETIEMDYHLKAGYSSSARVQMENKLSDDDSFIFGCDLSHDRDNGIGFSADLMVTNYIDNENQIGSGIEISKEGIQFKLVYRRDRHAFSIPITCCEELSWKDLFYWTVIPSIFHFFTSQFIIKPLRNRNLKEMRKSFFEKTKEKSTIAKKQIESIKEESLKKYNEEEKSNGLVILNARYGVLSDSVGNEFSMCIDVTIPLRNLVYNSSLKLECDSKSQLFGFYDPCPSKSKELEIVFKFKGVESKIIVDDEDALELPDE